jgi:hypothetical protein
MGFASRGEHTRGRNDICLRVEAGTRTDHETLGHVPTNQSRVALVFTV